MKAVLLALSLTTLLNAAPSAEVSQLAQDHTQFALSLYKTVQTTQDNFIFSPYSVASCLSMLYVGARGETQAQMQRALHLDIEPKNIGKVTAALSASLAPKLGEKQFYQLTNANSLWVDQGIFLLTDFRYAIEKQFKATLNTLNFTKKQEALAAMNSWIDNQTAHKIPQLLQQDDLSELTRLVLLNAIYFEGNWTFPFNPTRTQDWPFHPSPDQSVAIKMMQQTALLPYYDNELVQVAALPFQGKSMTEGQLAFLVVLPKSAENFEMMETELSNELNNWISSLNPTRLDLKLPKFEQNTRLDLNTALQEIGMEDAFNSDANFTGIDGMRDLFVNKVIHQAYFALDEQGVVATAATAAALDLTSAPPDKVPPVRLYADHPFLYFIIDLQSHELLFMGTMRKPR